MKKSSVEQLRSEMNAQGRLPNDESPSNNVLTAHEVPDTPFKLQFTEMGWCITYGKYRISDFHEERQPLENMIAEKSWTILTRVIGIIADSVFGENLKSVNEWLTSSIEKANTDTTSPGKNSSEETTSK